MPERTPWIRRGVLAGLLALVLVSTAQATPAAAQLPAPPSEPEPHAWILVDADSGEILDASNEHEPTLVASTIKLLTAITVLEHLGSDTVLTVSELAAGRPAFDINMQAGEQWLLPHALSAMLIVSANDAAYALAEASAGSVEAFARQMEATGDRLGIRDSTFSDPAGLDDEMFSFGGGSRVSAYDLAIIGRNALAIPAIAERAAAEHEVFEDLNGATRTLPTRNSVFLGRYEGATGLKTGGTNNAGTSLVASASRDGRTLVAVVLGVPDTAAWAGMLLDRGFSGAATGTGRTLPPVHVATADETRAALEGAPRLLGRGPFVLDDRVPPPDGAQEEPASPPEVLGETERAQAGDETPAPSGGGTGWFRNLAIGAVLVLVGLALLRRRMITRRRRRRLARQQALSEARRRGMIDVIDPHQSRGSDVRVHSPGSRRR